MVKVWRQRGIAAVVLAALLVGMGGAVAWLRKPAPSDTQRRLLERAHVPPGMVTIPGDWCLLGSDDTDADEDVRPMRRVFVPSFAIDRTEVTNAEFKRFHPSRAYPPGEDDLPVTNVTYAEAEAYARRAGKRLPTEEEWEKAARGTDGRRYPWGSDWDAKRAAACVHPSGKPVETRLTTRKPGQCAIGPSRVRPVGSKPKGASPYGCLDMAGNAWEWVQGFYRENPEQRILRGGAVGYGEWACRAYARAIEGAGAT